MKTFARSIKTTVAPTLLAALGLCSASQAIAAVDCRLKLDGVKGELTKAKPECRQAKRGITVVIKKGPGNLNATQTSSSEGEFKFTGLAAGNYELALGQQASLKEIFVVGKDGVLDGRVVSNGGKQEDFLVIKLKEVFISSHAKHKDEIALQSWSWGSKANSSNNSTNSASVNAGCPGGPGCPPPVVEKGKSGTIDPTPPSVERGKSGVIQPPVDSQSEKFGWDVRTTETR